MLYNCTVSLANDSTSATSALSVKYRGVSGYYVCSNHWTSALSDAVCRQLGHGSVSFTYFIHISYIYSVSQQNSPPAACGFLTFSDEQLRISNQCLHTYYTFLSTLEYKFLLSHLKLQRSYAIHRVPKKETTKLLAITFSNLNRFLKFFHC